ncbi:MAG: 50S ribosomal protein L21 [Dehalococcoidia bacterium]
MYAIVKTGGKQVKVSEGQTIDVERLYEEEGSSVDLDQVLLLSDDEKVVAGQPVVDGAKVKATVVEHGRSPKVTVFKYKNKIRYRRKKGHRQPYTRLKVDQIVTS